MQKIDTSSLIIDTASPADMWCVYDHQTVLTPGEPPVTILVGACRLIDVHRLLEGKSNTEWNKIFIGGGSVQVNVLYICDNRRYAQEQVGNILRTMNPKPVCNIKGYSLRGNKRPILCLNNNKVYPSQTDAAKDLGISASGISRHMAGGLSQVNGFRFIFATEAGIGEG